MGSAVYDISLLYALQSCLYMFSLAHGLVGTGAMEPALKEESIGKHQMLEKQVCFDECAVLCSSWSFQLTKCMCLSCPNFVNS